MSHNRGTVLIGNNMPATSGSNLMAWRAEVAAGTILSGYADCVASQQRANLPCTCATGAAQEALSSRHTRARICEACASRTSATRHDEALVEQCFEQYDFGNDVLVDTGSWSFDGAGSWSRSIFVENLLGERNSIKKTFKVVVFKSRINRDPYIGWTNITAEIYYD